MRPYLIAGNWKMNLLTAEALSLVENLDKALQKDPVTAQVAICPPFTLLSPVQQSLDKPSPIKLGAQDCSAYEGGAYTGEISPKMLTDQGCQYVILGHSERRAYHGEKNTRIQEKAENAHNENLVTILCIGETESDKDNDLTNQVTEKQLIGSLPKTANSTNTVIAYEPIWAIGTGRTPFPAEVQAVHKHLRDVLTSQIGETEAEKIQILYGGSVKPENAKEFFALPDVDGALVGGAALKAESFLGIIQAVNS